MNSFTTETQRTQRKLEVPWRRIIGFSADDGADYQEYIQKTLIKKLSVFSVPLW
jgi:hypothetical protein